MAKTVSSRMTSTAEERLIVLSSLLNYGRIVNMNDEDIKGLYQRIEKIKKVDTERDLDLLYKYDLETIKSTDDLRNRIQQIKANFGKVLFEKYGVSKINSAIYDSLRATSYGNGKDAKNQTCLTEKSAQNIADIIEQNKLDEFFESGKGKTALRQTYADKLGEIIRSNTIALTERMRHDFDNYKSRIKNPLVEEVVPDINYFLFKPSEIRIHFITGKSERKAQPGDEARAVREFNDIKRKRREEIRRYFREKDIKEKPRPLFIILISTMQNIGHMYCDNKLRSMNENNVNSSFSEIENVVAKIYDKDKEKVLQGMFGKDYAQNKKNVIRRCVDLYGKLYTACLSEKICKEWKNDINMISKDEKKDFNDKIPVFINSAIESGKLNPYQIFSCPLEKEEDGETNLISSIHHNFSIGCIEDSCGKLAYYGVRNTSPKSCSDVVNNLGLFTEVIGKEVHKSLEPIYELVLSAQKNGFLPRNTIFAGSAKGINKDVLKILNLDIGPELHDMIMENIKTKDKEGRIFAYMELPEGEVVNKMREECRNKDEQLIQRNILDLAKIFTDKDNS